jgi:vacuolar protein sorting-associated protein 18
MNDATRGADNIRSDINALSQRYIVIDRSEECGVCKRKILGTRGAQQMGSSYISGGNIAPLYVFPCSHAFHAPCLIAHVTRCTTHAQVSSIISYL